MFEFCPAIKDLDLSKWKVTKDVRKQMIKQSEYSSQSKKVDDETKKVQIRK